MRISSSVFFFFFFFFKIKSEVVFVCTKCTKLAQWKELEGQIKRKKILLRTKPAGFLPGNPSDLNVHIAD